MPAAPAPSSLFALFGYACLRGARASAKMTRPGGSPRWFLTIVSVDAAEKGPTGDRCEEVTSLASHLDG